MSSSTLRADERAIQETMIKLAALLADFDKTSTIEIKKQVVGIRKSLLQFYVRG